MLLLGVDKKGNIMVEKLNKYKKTLVLAVGGGNDSVSTLLLQLQLQKDFGYNPDHIDIAAVLPDCLQYENMESTNIELCSTITPNSIRKIKHKELSAFPERILSQNKNVIPELNINNVLGLSMSKGSIGIKETLIQLVESENYDLILAIDVGGDFIAHKDNLDVLSPMMDGYMLYALKGLEKHIKENHLKTSLLFSIFGLGTDGESTPEMLDKAMSLIPDITEYSFDKEHILPFVKFYRNTVEKNRYSRTTDYTILEICEEEHPNPSDFRGRFHVKENISEKRVMYGNFKHYQDPRFYGKYYLFNNIDNIDNIYSKECRNGIEWFLNVQKESTKINHELNGQSYFDLGLILDNEKLSNKSIFFSTPSRKFSKSLQTYIARKTSKSILNEIYDMAIIYNENIELMNKDLIIMKLNKDLSLIGKNEEILKEFIKLT